MEYSVSDRADEEARKSSEVYPEILDRVRRKEDLLVIADSIAEKVNIDRTTAYRWVYIVDTEFQRRRRWIARTGAAFLWVFTLSLAGGLFAVFVRPEAQMFGLPGYAVLFVLAGITAFPALYMSIRADAIAMSRRSPFD
ncbi:MAG: hypothetical protein ACOC0B_00705 [bacterium]